MLFENVYAEQVQAHIPFGQKNPRKVSWKADCVYEAQGSPREGRSHHAFDVGPHKSLVVNIITSPST